MFVRHSAVHEGRLRAIADFSRACVCWLGIILASFFITQVLAGDLRTRTPRGETLQVYEDEEAGSPVCRVQRFTSETAYDRSFGQAGVATLMAPLEPAAITVDDLGRAYIAANVAETEGGRVARLLWTGVVDTDWGSNGIATLYVSRGAGRVSDLIVMKGDSTGTWAIGTITVDGAERAALWKLNDHGQPDRAWMNGGPLVAIGGEPSRGIALAQDGSRLLAAVARIRRSGQTIEVLAIEPLRTPGSGELIAQQPYSPNWGKPPALIRENGEWRWVDSARPARSFLKVALFKEPVATAGWEPAPQKRWSDMLSPFTGRTVAAPPTQAPGIVQTQREPENTPWAIYATVLMAAALLLAGIMRWKTRRSL